MMRFARNSLILSLAVNVLKTLNSILLTRKYFRLSDMAVLALEITVVAFVVETMLDIK